VSESRSQLSEAARYALGIAREQLAGRKLLVLTGAGVSTESGIPDYRGAGKVPKHPMTFSTFMGSTDARSRYWARSFVGWSRIALAKPNSAHFSLAQAEAFGQISHLITQNVDQLHQAAGSKKVIDLHGRLDTVVCTKCQFRISRQEMDHLIQSLNPNLKKDQVVEFSPDGDAEIEDVIDFQVPECPSCLGILKPDVVFFGETVPSDRVRRAMDELEDAEGLLVAGSSLSVNSGLRFVKRAKQLELPIVIVNLGPTKADSLCLAKIEASVSKALEALLID
jgi:NAD-dependent SIR2 family protein deacetylase